MSTPQGEPQIGWDDIDPGTAYEGLCRAHDLGVTLFDTADVYGLGQSERLLGRLLRHVDRDSVVVSSKVGYFAGTADHPYEPRQMRHQFATTLDNLGTDYLDIYFLHSTDFGENDLYLASAIDVMRELRDAGQVRAIGIRAPHTFAVEWATTERPEAAATTRWLRLVQAVRPDVVTVRHNLLSPLYDPQETDIFDFARQLGIGVLIKQALAQGTLLRDPVGLRPSYSGEDHRSRDPMFQPPALASLRARLAPIYSHFGTDPTTLARLALGYALQRDPNAAVLVGFRNAHQIHDAVTSAVDPTTPQEISQLRALLHPTSPATSTERARS